MKKNIIYIFLFSVLFATVSCSDENFSDKYKDKTGFSEAKVPELMSGVFEKGDKYTMPWYTRYFTFEAQQLGRYAQTLGWLNQTAMYQGSDSYNDTRWKQFYDMVTQYRALEKSYVTLTAVEKRDYEMFILASRIYLYDHLQQMIDLWGDVPFADAGTLFFTSDIQGSKPAYQSQNELYQMVMADLKEINPKLAVLVKEQDLEKGGIITKTAFQNFKIQDYINHGDLKLWQKYCNSLCLRYAARAAERGVLATEAQAIVKEILSDTSKFPIIDSNDSNILIHYNSTYHYAFGGGSDGIQGGLESWGGQLNRASKKMMDEMMDGSTRDPRFEIMFDPNKQGEYVAIDPLMPASQQNELFNKKTPDGKKSDNYFASIDSTTFSRNNKFPGIIMTAAEVSYIKAEAIEKKWLPTGDAKAEFVNGFKQSVDFYFDLNKLSSYKPSPAKPSPATIENFAMAKWDKTMDKKEAIAIQKWLHYGNIQMVQAWSESRKTGFPKMELTPDNLTPSCPLPPNRLKYTSDERTYNTENYEKVRSKDTYTEKIFWAK